uniref:DUF4794 domain-containing protein n=1 Tax=Glossina palpalis gambiensis TaxID=67801 RepID=A0A1B0BAB3_9MUSC
MFYLNLFSLSLLVMILSAFAVEEGQRHLKILSLLPANLRGVFYADPARAEPREREPTTKRPLREEKLLDNIDDYENSTEQEVKEEEASRINNPYPLATNPRFIGFGNYPSNGILVGPGGPTGIIGRPQQYPNAFLNYPSIDYPNYNNGYLAATYPLHYGMHISYPNQLYPAQPFYTEGYGLANNNFLVGPFPHLRSNINEHDERAKEAEGNNLKTIKTNPNPAKVHCDFVMSSSPSQPSDFITVNICFSKFAKSFFTSAIQSLSFNTETLSDDLQIFSVKFKRI